MLRWVRWTPSFQSGYGTWREVTMTETEQLREDLEKARELCRGFAKVLLVASLVSTGQVEDSPDLQREVEQRITELLQEFRQQPWSTP
jgi:hypothetical protein